MNALAYRVAAAAATCGVSQATIRAAIDHGELKAKKKGAALLILEADLAAWLNALPNARN